MAYCTGFARRRVCVCVCVPVLRIFDLPALLVVFAAVFAVARRQLVLFCLKGLLASSWYSAWRVLCEPR